MTLERELDDLSGPALVMRAAEVVRRTTLPPDELRAEREHRNFMETLEPLAARADELLRLDPADVTTNDAQQIVSVITDLKTIERHERTPEEVATRAHDLAERLRDLAMGTIR